MKTKKEVEKLGEYYENLGVKYTYIDKTYDEQDKLSVAHNQNLIKTYGITVDDYNYMLDVQNGLCAICGKKEEAARSKKENPLIVQKNKRLAVDHCHKTGKVRGLLCWRCNVGLGFFNDKEEYLEKAKNYIKFHRAKI